MKGINIVSGVFMGLSSRGQERALSLSLSLSLSFHVMGFMWRPHLSLCKINATQYFFL
jgi:hypothetical protein